MGIHTIDTLLCLNTAGAWSLWTVYQNSWHDEGVGLFVPQVDGLRWSTIRGGHRLWQGPQRGAAQTVSLHGHTVKCLGGNSASQLTFVTIPGGLGNNSQSL